MYSDSQDSRISNSNIKLFLLILCVIIAYEKIQVSKGPFGVGYKNVM